MKTTLILFLFVTTHYIFSQKIFYQDICNCGVTGAGFSNGISGLANSGQIVTNLDINSVIKKAFLIYGRFGETEPITINFNGQNLTLSTSNQAGNKFVSFQENNLVEFSSIHIKDVTEFVNINQNTYLINTPLQSHTIGESGFFGSFYLIIVYENPNFEKSVQTLIVNELNSNSVVDYSFNNLMPINNLFPVSLAIHSDIIWDTITDGSFIEVNNNLIGLIGGDDNINSQFLGGGVKGHFYYLNNELFGLDDDLPNLSMNGTDGLADISSIITNTNNINIRMTKQMSAPYNMYLSFNLAYTSSCASFPVTTSPDTSVCKGSTLQLQASGGVQYEWLPFAGLSCSNCPNPIVQTDSSQFYTVRIWNNDSCSVVRPVHVTVYQPAKFSGISISPATCGEANGQLTATLSNTAYLPLSFSVNNAPFQNSSTYTKQFQNLPYGPLLLTAKDGHQCTIDTLLTIPYNNTCSALFTASPSTGATPLNVQFSNQSTNATNYAWEINATSLGSILNNHIFDTAGTYFVQLYAWQNIPECIDSFSVQIIVFDSLVVQVPNVFTVNNDGVNDVFSLSSNQQITVAYSIVDRWGTVAASGTSKSLPITNGVYTTTIWDGRNATNGVYFYTITLQSQGENKIVNGFVERLD
jgi:PKD repeat protein